MQRSAVNTANEVVPIAFVCNKIGMAIPDHLVLSGRSMKVQCPFGELYHEDGGRSAAFRIYPDTNSGWCFACSEFYSPVKLYAASTGLEWSVAAEQLLDMVGHRGSSFDARWEAAVAGQQELPSLDALAEALKTFCLRIFPEWPQRQFEQATAAKLGECLRLLNLVGTDEQAVQWLAVTKQVMELELRGTFDAAQ